ncbi:MAG TPA: universal stress protein [Puia sp.]|jgi:nucleotide-binding universal stress UspA family protein|nr:universal stress protein [Puia sp.]
MKSIVIPVNFSTCSDNAARYAANLAQAIRASLHLVHVIEIPITSADMVMTEALYEEMVESSNTSLKALQFDLQKRTNNTIKVDIRIEVGSVTGKMKELCQEIQPYAIVLGASGPSFEKFLAGSPVASLLHNLNYPVLVVPETATFHQFRRVLLACDLDDIGSGIPISLPLLKDLRQYFGSKFDIVTVETGPVLSEEQKTFKYEGWKEQLKDLYPEIHYVRNSKVEDGIQEYLGKNEADLVMVFPKKHSFFEFHISQSKKFTKHSTIPVMSVHE